MSGGGIASLTKVSAGSDTTSFIITPDRPPLKKKKGSYAENTANSLPTYFLTLTSQVVNPTETIANL